MDKFKSFKLITDQYLDGKLVELKADYIDENHVKLLISYECNNFFTLDYEMSVDLDSKDIHFISHGSNKAFEKIRLSNEPSFDKAVSKYFFAK
jgi:hypothetical protein